MTVGGLGLFGMGKRGQHAVAEKLQRGAAVGVGNVFHASKTTVDQLGYLFGVEVARCKREPRKVGADNGGLQFDQCTTPLWRSARVPGSATLPLRAVCGRRARRKPSFALLLAVRFSGCRRNASFIRGSGRLSTGFKAGGRWHADCFIEGGETVCRLPLPVRPSLGYRSAGPCGSHGGRAGFFLPAAISSGRCLSSGVLSDGARRACRCRSWATRRGTRFYAGACRQPVFRGQNR